MGEQARPLARAAPADNVVPLPGALEAVIRALAGALTAGACYLPAPSTDPAVDKPLLDLEETAGLLGVSRMTVARMADEGRLPSVVIRRGRSKNTPDPTGIRQPDSRRGLRWRRGGLGRVHGCLAR